MVINPGDPDTPQRRILLHQPGPHRRGVGPRGGRRGARGAGPVPRYAAGAGRVKVPAAWLIERSGFAKGYGAPGPGARLHQAHARPGQRGRRHDRRPAGPGPRDRLRRPAAFGVTLTPSPSWSAPPSNWVAPIPQAGPRGSAGPSGPSPASGSTGSDVATVLRVLAGHRPRGRPACGFCPRGPQGHNRF